MTYRLVIVESPAKAKTIEKYLPDDCHVSATMGHIIDLPKSKLGIDIDDNFKPLYQPIRGKGQILKELKSMSKKANEVILATDPDREGEAISYHLANYLGLDLSEDNRIEFHEITPTAIASAMDHKRAVNMDLVDAQQARRVLDRLVGYQISPVLWRKVMRGLSAGRVQSVATRMIVDRENEIRAFVSEEYWNLSVKLSKVQGDKTVFDAHLLKIDNKKFKITSVEEADQVKDDLEKAPYKVLEVKKSEKKRKPAPPFTTSTLQQDAYRRLNFSTKKTMMLAQQLYEGLDVDEDGHVGLITYMRTDSVRISEDAIAQAADVIGTTYGKDFVGSGNARKSTKKQANVQDAHEGIRPTDLKYTPESLSKSLTPDQLKLYTLIYKRFLASRMSEAVFDTISVDISASDKYLMRSSGSQLKFAGFLKVYDSEEDDPESQKTLPDLEAGEDLKNEGVLAEQKFTQPPPRYTEASLVKAMEEVGIGRPSTYAPTISTLLARNYVVVEEKKFMPTELGEIVVNLMVENFENIVDVDFTSKLELHLDKIADGTEKWVDVMADFYEDFKQDLEKADSIEHVKLPTIETDEICEKCGRNMVVKYGRFGQFLACPGYPECTNAKPITKPIDVECPECGSPIVQRKTKKNRAFYGCKAYPNCTFVSWQKPTNKECPECGKMLFESGKKLVCNDKACGYKSS
jgi:DNA topoisomerase-1